MTFWHSISVPLLVALASLALTESTLAQSIDSPPPQAVPPLQLPFQENQPPSLQPQPIPEPQPTLPSLEELLQPTQPAPVDPQPIPGEVPATIRVERFDVVGSTVFTSEELAAATAPFTNRDITFVELLQARSAVTQLYAAEGYITSGAIIPPQALQG